MQRDSYLQFKGLSTQLVFLKMERFPYSLPLMDASNIRAPRHIKNMIEGPRAEEQLLTQILYSKSCEEIKSKKGEEGAEIP